MKENIKERLDKYLEFDSDLLFGDTSDYRYRIMSTRLVRIFGGAIRDIIAGYTHINDIDILVGAKSMPYLEHLLSSNGYLYMDNLTPKGLNDIYKEIKVINEPHTWLKGTKIVQLIRPVHKINNDYEKSFRNLISNVDISCCGVSYDGENLYENYPDAVSHARNMVYKSNRQSSMYLYARCEERKRKLNYRGWSEIGTLAVKRDLKLDKLLNTIEIDFIKEYEKKKKTHYIETNYDDGLPF